MDLIRRFAGDNRVVISLLVRYEIWKRVRLDKHTQVRFNALRKEARDILQKREDAGLPAPTLTTEDRNRRSANHRYSRG